MNMGTDDDEVVEKAFTENIRSSIIALKFECYNVVTREMLPYNGQAGFVRNPKTLQQSRDGKRTRDHEDHDMNEP